MGIIIIRLYLITLNMCFGCSLISFKLHFPFHLRLFSILIGLAVATEFAVPIWLHNFHHSTNYPVYDIYMLLEYGLYAFYFKMIIQKRWMRQVIFCFIAVLPIVWVITTFFIAGFTAKWNVYMVLFGDSFAVAMCIGYFYEAFISDRLIDFKTSPEFWIAVGILFYSCCEIPVSGMLNYLEANYQPTAMVVLSALQILNILMYSIFIYAYLCPLKTNTKN
jgi:hypothetical protein